MISCCNGCEPPKRNGYCHTYCEEYLKAKEKHEQEKAIEDQKKTVAAGLASQACAGIYKARKIKRQMKGRNYGY